MAARSSKKKVKRAQAYRRSGKASNRSKNVPMNSLDELLNERKKRRPSRARPNSHSAVEGSEIKQARMKLVQFTRFMSALKSSTASKIKERRSETSNESRWPY